MTDRITVELDIAPVVARLDALLRQLGPGGLDAPLREMGEDLVESIKRRFETSTGPDGTRWAPNSMATIMGYLEQTSGNYRKDGRLSKKGAGRAMSKKPLVASGILQGTIRYEVAGDSLFVGTNRFAGDWDGGAAVLHFGSKDGSIPGRPFLGADEEDVQRMLDVLERYFSG
ncbi:phage virion morphogenesis protein [Thauera butanivorans]|uniref:phage virion morphogenesis protein n=1 Tax=Thauera butanivorans TaxID=86174 RepID=UPI0008395AA1|nr:phage virion morphogenesis protein [Thauera butanivorans]